MIYCVEDDDGIRNMMIYTLNASGFEAKGFESGVPFFDALEKALPELMILDIMLPGEDGITILKKIRSNPTTKEIPVIMATAKGSEYDKVIGLDLGADDYLAKPFGMMEMISRVKAVLRRASPKKQVETIKIGQLSVNHIQHSVYADGKKICLTLKEYELLRLFMENPEKVFSRDELLSVIWGEDFVGETRTVDVHIGTLRMKIGKCGDYIQTVRGVGYKLDGEE